MTDMEPGLVRRTRNLGVEDLRVSDLNVRLEPNPAGVELLAESIRTVGLQHPLVVRPVRDEEGVYEVVEGSRRLQALKTLGYRLAECRIVEMDDEQALVASIHENIVRGDITAAELARGMRRMMEMMPADWDDRKKRKEMAKRLGWVVKDAKGRPRPDLTRVKDALLMGEFQEKLPGIVIKQRTRGDSVKPTLAWSTARQVREIVSDFNAKQVLDAMPPEARSEHVKRIARTYKDVPTKHRSEFVKRFRAAPGGAPEDIARDLVLREMKALLLPLRVDPVLHQAIDAYAQAHDLKRGEAVLQLLRQGLERSGQLPATPGM
jgi:ParB/RepB/Spo0J family partition protein